MEIIQPKVFVVSAPSGSGKSTIIHQAIKQNPDLVLTVSHTSRLPRKGEVPGFDYHFISAEEFKKKIKSNEFLEWAEVHGNFYGTSISEITRNIQEGRVVILDIDVQGALQIRKAGNIKPVYIFIEPPSIEELRNRLVNRDTDSEATIEKRIKNAETELRYKDQYDHVILNDRLEKAVNEFVQLIEQYTSKASI